MKNPEALLDYRSNAISLFRDLFKSAVCELGAQGQDILHMSEQEVIQCAREHLEKAAWYVSDMNITCSELQLFDAVMVEYLVRVQKFLAHHQAGNEGLQAAFYQMLS